MHGKRYKEAEKSIDPKKIYSPDEALDLIKNGPKEKFDASIEIHIKLGIDPKKETSLYAVPWSYRTALVKLKNRRFC